MVWVVMAAAMVRVEKEEAEEEEEEDLRSLWLNQSTGRCNACFRIWKRVIMEVSGLGGNSIPTLVDGYHGRSIRREEVGEGGKQLAWVDLGQCSRSNKVKEVASSSNNKRSSRSSSSSSSSWVRRRASRCRQGWEEAWMMKRSSKGFIGVRPTYSNNNNNSSSNSNNSSNSSSNPPNSNKQRSSSSSSSSNSNNSNSGSMEERGTLAPYLSTETKGS